jgi:hypothetical protein
VRLLEHDGDLVVRDDRPEHAAQRGEEIHHVEPRRRDRDASRFDLREIEQVVHHLVEVHGRALDESELLLLLLVERPVQAVEHDARDAADRAERRAEFVTHVGEESALQIRCLAQLHRRIVELGVESDDAAIGLD